MDRGFNGVWQKIQTDLSRGEIIRNWGLRGYSGHQFKIAEIERNAVVVSLDNGNQRRISKPDFENVFGHLSDLRSGRISRQELGSQSQNTSYILSLFRWSGTIGTD
jgi:hypothetical protein